MAPSYWSKTCCQPMEPERNATNFCDHKAPCVPPLPHVAVWGNQERRVIHHALPANRVNDLVALV